MQECDLLKAVEKAAFMYLFGVLINRIGKLLAKRSLAVLALLVGAAFAKEPLPIGAIIGLIVALGVGIWSSYDAVKTMRNVIKEFSNHMWQSFKRLPRRLLNQSLLDCLNRKPECCELFQSEVSKLLAEWVKGLKPGWKKGNPLTSSLKWRQMQRDIKRKITDSLKKCCVR